MTPIKFRRWPLLFFASGANFLLRFPSRPLSNFEISLSYRRKGTQIELEIEPRGRPLWIYIGRVEREPSILSAEFRGSSRSCAWEDNVSPSRAFRFLNHLSSLRAAFVSFLSPLFSFLPFSPPLPCVSPRLPVLSASARKTWTISHVPVTSRRVSPAILLSLARRPPGGFA